MRYLLLSAVFLFFSCDKEAPTPGEDLLGLSYYPLQEGSFWVYDVERQDFYSDGSENITTYQLRYRITAVEEEDLLYSVEVSQRDEAEEPFQITGQYETYRNEKIAVINYGSASYIKMSFPVKNGRSWDGNSLNSEDEDIYQLDSAGNDFSFRGRDFSNTVTVIQEYSIDPVQITSDNVALEVYARDVGLVYSELKKIEYKSCSSIYPECCTQNSAERCFGEIDEGYIVYQYLKEHGHE